jgi:threonine synthase
MLDFLHKAHHKKQGGIWKYADFYAENIKEENRLVLEDGSTELSENKNLNKYLNIEHLYFKREDENETGSLKGRSLAYQVSLNKQRGAGAMVISTSGNAGIAAAAYAKKAGIKIFIFISPKTEKRKIADMQKYGPVIVKSRRAIRFANYASAKFTLPNLRPSVDDDSIEGFKSIALEIADEVADIDAIFTFVTSGSSFIGIYRGFEKYRQLGKIDKIPGMYAVQSGEITSIAEEFEENGCLIAKETYLDEEEIKAGQLGSRNTKRKKEILDIIQKKRRKGDLRNRCRN